MCLILLGYHIHPRYRLILAANRDEFYSRETAPLDYWADHPDILAGRDLKQMGTWLGVSRQGRIAAITNYREPEQRTADPAPSRGHLVSRYLIDGHSSRDYLENLVSHGRRYSGFNLVVGDPNGLHYYGNRSGAIIPIPPGWHGLSNHLLNTDWPKTRKGLQVVQHICNPSGDILVESLFEILADDALASDDLLPDTGVGLEWERTLSAIFIRSPHYGTRSSSVILIDNQNQVQFWERTHPSPDVPTSRSQTHHFRFRHE